jgi:hypothetical protein
MGNMYVVVCDECKKVLVCKVLNIVQLFKLLYIILLPFEFRLISRICCVSCCGEVLRGIARYCEVLRCVLVGLLTYLLIICEVLHSASGFIPNTDEVTCV